MYTYPHDMEKHIKYLNIYIVFFSFKPITTNSLINAFYKQLLKKKLQTFIGF